MAARRLVLSTPDQSGNGKKRVADPDPTHESRISKLEKGAEGFVTYKQVVLFLAGSLITILAALIGFIVKFLLEFYFAPTPIQEAVSSFI